MVESQLKQHAAAMLECPEDELELREGGAVGVIGANKEVTFLEISLRAHWAVGGPIVGHNTFVFDQPTIDPKRAVAKGMPFGQIGVYSFGCVIVDLSIDEVTGQAEVVEAWSAMDIGRAINPSFVEGQIEGGFVQGLGFALTEEMVWDAGRLANPSLMDYKVPTTMDVPYDIHSIIVESHETDGPFGAKGVGEICLVPVPSAIANAVTAALGESIKTLPITPEKVLVRLLEGEHES